MDGVNFLSLSDLGFYLAHLSFFKRGRFREGGEILRKKRKREMVTGGDEKRGGSLG